MSDRRSQFYAADECVMHGKKFVTTKHKNKKGHMVPDCAECYVTMLDPTGERFRSKY